MGSLLNELLSALDAIEEEGGIPATAGDPLPSIRALPLRYDVTAAVEQLAMAPDLWNLYGHRVQSSTSPHSGVMDVWLRFNPLRNLDKDPEAFFHGPHESEWYPAAARLPAVCELAESLFRDVRGAQLGGVLVTRIPPGGQIKPHVDTGWHAGYYEKFAVQLKGNIRQAFCFEDSQLSPMPGEAYTFDNSRLHWIRNDSDEDRMTLIVCVRRAREALH